MEIWLDIQSREGERSVPLAGSRMTIGRGEAADLNLSGGGLSRLHASIHREGDRVWVLDEGSANGTLVNDVSVSPRGTPLSDGDVIRLSGEATIVVRFENQGEKRSAASAQSAGGGHTTLPRITLVAAILLGVVFLSGVAVLAVRQFKNRVDPRRAIETRVDDPTPIDSKPVDPTPIETGQVAVALPPVVARPTGPAGGISEQSTPVLYVKMTQEQQYDFLDREARRVTLLIGNREYVFEREVLDYIKEYVDQYARRIGNGSTRLWGEDMNRIFDRAKGYAPLIIASFRKEGVPVVVGLYLPLIETEYRECLRSNAGALGLFQFIRPTAIEYGVDPDDRCQAEKMAPAAARYIQKRMQEFGGDGMSVALCIAGYNRDPKSVRRDLQDALDSRNNERSFWTLIAKKEKLDIHFQRENVKYVPKFFAAAMIGENPEAFGLRIRKLSTYDQR